MDVNFHVVGGILGATYITASLIFWRFPTLIHRKKVIKFSTLHCSHRGGAAEHLENTMEAFKHAVYLGTDLLELDCQITKDGKVVILHEPNLHRLTGINVNAYDVLYKDLPMLHERLHLHFDNEHVATGKDRKIALLEDLFRELPNVPINIDLKEGEERLILEVDRLIRKYDRAELCVWGNRSNRITKKCFEVNPEVPLLFSMQRILSVITLFYTGLLPFVPIRESFMEIPYMSLYNEIMPPPVNMYDRFLRLIVKIIDWLLFNRFLFSHLDRRGIRILVWVLQKPEQFDFVLNKGAHGIMTDYPTILMEYFVTKGLKTRKQPDQTSIYSDSSEENTLSQRTKLL